MSCYKANQGFSNFTESPVTFKRTYQGIRILKFIGSSSISNIKDEIRKELVNKQTNKGGFRPYYSKRPSILSTFYALRISRPLRILDDIDVKNLFEFLLEQSERMDLTDMQKLYYFMGSLDIIHDKLDRSEQMKNLKLLNRIWKTFRIQFLLNDQFLNLKRNINHIYYFLKIMMIFKKRIRKKLLKDKYFRVRYKLFKESINAEVETLVID